MQPLLSPVDHETRRSSFQRSDEERPSEDTPLIVRFPNAHQTERHLPTIITVGFLLGILLAGLIIGIYLLVLQNSSENILPPVNDASQLKPLFALSHNNQSGLSSAELRPLEAQNVVILQTDTRQCDNSSDCIILLNKIKVENSNWLLSYNFLVSSGLVFEALGWIRSPVYTDLAPLVIAFIGNFTEVSPSHTQIEAAKDLMTTAVSRHYLTSTFNIIGKNSKYHPRELFKSLSSLPQWNSDLSDVE